MKNRFNPELCTSPVLISRAKETWEDMEGFEGLYQMSNLKNVKSLARKGRLKDKILKKIPRGSCGFVVYLCKDNVMEPMYISNKDYNSKVATDYKDKQLTKDEIEAKRRLEIALSAHNKMLALRTFKNSKFMLTKLN